MIGSSLLPHAESMDYGKGFMTSLDHSIWIHDHMFRVDEWLLYDMHAPILCTSPAVVQRFLLSRHIPTPTGTHTHNYKLIILSMALLSLHLRRAILPLLKI
jgi:hypothetical protein